MYLKEIMHAINKKKRFQRTYLQKIMYFNNHRSNTYTYQLTLLFIIYIIWVRNPTQNRENQFLKI